jgi:hypothetical protein
MTAGRKPRFIRHEISKKHTTARRFGTFEDDGRDTEWADSLRTDVRPNRPVDVLQPEVPVGNSDKIPVHEMARDEQAGQPAPPCVPVTVHGPIEIPLGVEESSGFAVGDRNESGKQINVIHLLPIEKVRHQPRWKCHVEILLPGQERIHLIFSLRRFE